MKFRALLGGLLASALVLALMWVGDRVEGTVEPLDSMIAISVLMGAILTVQTILESFRESAHPVIWLMLMAAAAWWAVLVFRDLRHGLHTLENGIVIMVAYFAVDSGFVHSGKRAARRKEKNVIAP